MLPYTSLSSLFSHLAGTVVAVSGDPATLILMSISHRKPPFGAPGCTEPRRTV